MLYFRGCTAREKQNDIAEATEKILKIAGVDFHTLDDEKCCGSVLLRTGFIDEAAEQIKKNTEVLKGQKIITSCAGCYKTLKEDYKNYLGVDLKVIHISQLLEQLINENKINLKGNKDLKVTYHDSCHLGRHAGEYEAPRNVINSISNLVEMENNREKARCCGSGGGVKSAYGDLSNSIADLRIQEAKDTDADLLVSACPFCKLNLSQNSDDLEILDLSEFVLEHLDSADDNEITSRSDSKEGEIQ